MIQRREGETTEAFFWRLATEGPGDYIKELQRQVRAELDRRAKVETAHANASYPDPTTPEALRYAAEVVQRWWARRETRVVADNHALVSASGLRDAAERLEDERAAFVSNSQDQELASKLAAHGYREQDHSTIAGLVYCNCGWQSASAGRPRFVHGLHVASVIKDGAR